MICLSALDNTMLQQWYAEWKEHMENVDARELEGRPDMMTWQRDIPDWKLRYEILVQWRSHWKGNS